MRSPSRSPAAGRRACRCMAMAQRTASATDANVVSSPSPSHFTSWPPWPAMPSLSSWRCARRMCWAGSSPTRCSSAVELARSVKSSVVGPPAMGRFIPPRQTTVKAVRRTSNCCSLARGLPALHELHRGRRLLKGSPTWPASTCALGSRTSDDSSGRMRAISSGRLRKRTGGACESATTSRMTWIHGQWAGAPTRGPSSEHREACDRQVRPSTSARADAPRGATRFGSCVSMPGMTSARLPYGPFALNNCAVLAAPKK